MKKIILIIAVGVSLLTGFLFFHFGIEPEVLIEKYAQPESKFIEIDGQKVHYRETGKGKPLILLHGVSSSLLTWNGWHKELSKDFRVISVDLPAFAITGPFPNDDYSFNHYLEFLEKFMDKLGIEKTYMAGNSFGGNLTWRFAHKNPNRVIKIAILDASGLKKNKNSLAFFLSSTPGISILSHYFTPKFMVEKSVKDFYGDPSKVTDSLVTTYYELLLRKGNRQAFTKVLNQFDENELKKIPTILSEIKTPTLILWGEKDPRYFPEVAKKFHKYIPNAKLIIYPNVGHMPMEENPIQSAKDFRKFVLEE